jgi:hypothetical protein
MFVNQSPGRLGRESFVNQSVSNDLKPAFDDRMNAIDEWPWDYLCFVLCALGLLEYILSIVRIRISRIDYLS